VQPAFSNGRFARIDPGYFDPDHDLTVRRVGHLHFCEVEDVPSAVVVEPYGLGHGNSLRAC
jgi:hypothetical protein